MDSRDQSPAPPATPGSSDPAPEQAPVATENQKAIVGDPGFGEQQPRQAPANPDQPHGSSAPPPEAQSGTPLPEDRAAQAADEQAADEAAKADAPDWEPGE